jgi:DivIVA domain-containing protein
MGMTPEHVAAKEFVVGLRGYDPKEVRTFLQEVATELRGALEADGEIERFGDHVGSIVSAAEEAADTIRLGASQQAARLIELARQRALMVMDEAKTAAKFLRNEAADQRDAAVRIRMRAEHEAAGLVADARVRAAHIIDAAAMAPAPEPEIDLTVIDLREAVDTAVESAVQRAFETTL